MLFIGVASFNAYFSCLKCITKGEYINHRMSYPKINAVRRDDTSFRNRAQPLHHKDERSLMETLDIDMIWSFSTPDSLHLLDLGIIKKNLMRWIHGVKVYGGKWSLATKNSVSRKLLRCQNQMPTDIHRAIKSFDHLAHWKGVEFRKFLLYTGMVVLKDVLPTEEYGNFLNICCAVSRGRSNGRSNGRNNEMSLRIRVSFY